MKSRPNTLSIAGFDPSSGAGLTADIKTFEALKCYGLAVCTANTIQDDNTFIECHWVDVEVVIEQLDVLLERFDITFVKIGVIQNWKVLHRIVNFLAEKNKNIKIVLDPVLKSSSDFDFHDALVQADLKNEFDQVLDKIYLITPNYQEIEALYMDETMEETIKKIASKTHLLLKGGHKKEAIGTDELFTKDGKHFILHPKGNNNSEKHGSGCVLSSAITAYLALGLPLLKSCFRAKRYTEKVLSSNKNLLGYHRI